MAESTQLERIAGLVEKLDPLANKQRGMRIEAEQWNTLVDVVLGVLQLDRLQEQRTENLLDQRFAARDHEHLGQVSLTWLDADLQARLGGGGGSAVATRQLLSEMDQKISSLSDQVAKLTAALEANQRVLDNTIVNAADKTKKLLSFEDRFKGLEDLKTSVSTLSNDVGSVRVNVDKVLDLRKSLQDESGNPINVAQVKRDVGDLQLLRDNLKGADGKLLRLRDLEVRIGEVADVVGTGGPGGLEGRFATFSASLQDTLAGRTEVSINAVKTQFQTEHAALENRLKAEIQTSSALTRDFATQQLDKQLGLTTTNFNSTLDTRLGTFKDAVTKDAVDNTKALLNQRLSEAGDQTRKDLDAAVGTLRTTLTTNLQTSLGAVLTAQIKDADTRLSQQLGAVQASTKALTDSIPGIVSARLDDALPGLQNTLGQLTATQLETTKAAIEAGLATRVSTAVSNSLQNLDTRISTVVTQQTAGIDGKISTAVGTATRNLPANIADEVKSQIVSANLDSKISDSGKTIATQLRSELKTALADQDARTSTAIQSSVTLLQGQISAATTTTLNQAKDFITAQNTGLRTELTTLVNTRTKAVQDTFSTQLDQGLKSTRDDLSTEFNTRLDTQIRGVNDKFSTRFTTLETKNIRFNT